jgi:branched-chain amino acid transport system permease protein
MLTRDLVTALFFTFLFVTLAANYDILGGFLGYLNLGQATFFGFAAYVIVLLIKMPAVQTLGPWGIPAAAAAAAALTALLAFGAASPLFKLRGAYFAVATFGLLLMVRYLVLNLPALTGGTYGVYIPQTYYLELGWAYHLSLLLASGSVVLNYLLTRTRLGIALIAIRESEQAAAAIGINLFRYKRIALVLSATPTALAGAIFALHAGYIDVPSVFGLDRTAFPMIMAILGGSGHVWGPVVGTGIVRGIDVALKNYLVLPVPALGVHALILMGIGLFMPMGLMNTLGRRKQREQRAVGGRSR